MKILVVGGGKVGRQLALVLGGNRHSVAVIEQDHHTAQELAESSQALVIQGDGTDVRILDEADCEHADYMVAVTGNDEDNLVACQLARTAFECENVLARVNDPRNEPTFQALGVPRVSVTELLVQVLGQQLDLGDLNRLATLGSGEASLVEIEVPEDRSPAAVAALGLPDSTVLAAIRRRGRVIIPGGNDQVLPGDRIMIVTYRDSEDDARAVIRGEY